MGSKSYGADNILNPIGPKNGALEKKIREGFILKRYGDAYAAFDSDLADSIQVEFHEILGHGSGQLLAGVSDSDLGEFQSPWEEARAEVASLYYLLDPKIMELEILPSRSAEDFKTFSEMVILDFFTAHIRSYVRLSEKTHEIRQAHQLARQMMLNWLLKDGSLRIIFEDDVPRVEIVDIKAVREALGKFWGIIQMGKSTGNLKMVEKFVAEWGVYSDEHRVWRKHLLVVHEALGLPKNKIFLNPRFDPQRDEKGEIVDIRVRYYGPQNSVDIFMRDQLAVSQRVEQLQACAGVLENLPSKRGKQRLSRRD